MFLFHSHSHSHSTPPYSSAAPSHSTAQHSQLKSFSPLAQLLQTPFEYPTQSENDYESLEHSRAFPGHPPFGNEGSAGAVFRSDGYDPLNPPPFQQVNLRPANAFDYRHHSTNVARHDVPFQAGSGISMSPLTSSHGSSSTSPSSAASSFAFVPKSYHPNSNVPYHLGSYSTPASSVYSPASLYPQQYLHNSQQLEARPRITAIPSASGMPPPLRSSTNPSPVSPPLGTNVRENYSTLSPHSSRHGLSHHANIHTISASPLSPMSGTSRSVDSSVNRDSPSSGHPFLPAASMQLDANPQYPLGVPGVPPFDPTKLFCPVTDGGGTAIQVDIQAKIDKGFFKADTDWTCYRRNYFSVLCCYILKPDVDLSNQQLFLNRNSRERIQSFSVLIIAKVDGEDGKSVELVQHTPKRDKGPMTAPELTELSPHPSGNQTGYASSSSFAPSSALGSDFQDFSANTPQNQSVATFDRIQFKKATANNGKRRAAQQYFHIVVELWAKVFRGKSGDTQNVKVAHRVSAPMVVRGRSPGHYSDERRGSMGPGSGSGAEYSSGQGGSGAGGPSGETHGNRGGVAYSASGHNSTGGYQPHQMSMANSPSVSHSIGTSSSSSLGSTHDPYTERRSNPSLTIEEATKFDEYEGYQYYPSTLYEISPNLESSRPNLPLLRNPSFKPAASAPDSLAGLVTATPPDEYYSSRAKVKPEQSVDTSSGLQPSGSRTYAMQPSLLPLSGTGSALRDWRRFQGTDTSKGYYPAMPAL